MYYLLCFGPDDFAVKSFDDDSIAYEVAEKFGTHGFYDRIVLCESLAECVAEEEE